MKHTIDDLKLFILDNGYEIKPYSNDEIQIAINEFGNLPKVLIEFYEKIGEIDGMEDYIYIYSPTHLYQDYDGEDEIVDLMIFSSEMQGVDDYAIKISDLSEDNPLIYAAGDSFESISKLSKYRYVPCNHPDLDIMLVNNSMSLMNHLWTIIAYELQDDLSHLFDDNDLYALNDEEVSKRELRAQELQEEYEQSILVEKLIHENNDDIPYSPNVRSIELVLDDEHKNLDFLNNLPNLEHLYLQSAECSNWEGLKALTKLTNLHIKIAKGAIFDCNAIVNLLNLKKLYLYFGNIINEMALTNLINLTTLAITDTDLEDISFIKNLTKLKELNLSNNEISDISVLSNIIELKEFECENNDLTSVEALSNCKNLSFLRLANNNITSLKGLEKLDITNIELQDNSITDVMELSFSEKMYYLNLSNNPLSNIKVLEKMKDIQILYLSNTKIENINPLKNCTRLNRLKLNKTIISDISILESCKSLEHLDISHTQVSDISSLSIMSLDTLDIRYLFIDSLKKLKANDVHMPWHALDEYSLIWKDYDYFITHKLKSEFITHFASLSLFPRELIEDIVSIYVTNNTKIDNSSTTPSKSSGISEAATFKDDDGEYWCLEELNENKVRINECKKWYLDGTLKEIAFYEGEEGDTFTYKAYDEDGKLWQEGNFENGHRKILTLHSELGFLNPPAYTKKAVITKFSPNQEFLEIMFYGKKDELLSHYQDLDTTYSEIEYVIYSVWDALTNDNYHLAKTRFDKINYSKQSDIINTFYEMVSLAVQFFNDNNYLTFEETVTFMRATKVLEKQYPLVWLKEIRQQILIGYAKNYLNEKMSKEQL